MEYHGSHMVGLHDDPRPSQKFADIQWERETALMFLEDWAWNGNVLVCDGWMA
jgi:hypothetical protein